MFATRLRRLAALILLAPLLLAPAPVQQFSARVVGVEDGDTFRVLRGRETVRIRLFGVDAPENGQPFGENAREHAVRLLLHETVVVSMRDVDAYGRLVAALTVHGRDVAEQLVQAGAAWHYTQYSQDARLAALERSARASRTGLWALANPVAPWRFRELERERATSARGPEAHQPAGAFHGNRNSKIFHAPGCEHYTCPNCTAVFASAAAAREAGYRAHAACVR